MNITYTISQNEYHKAISLHQRNRHRWMLGMYILLAVIIVAMGTDFTNSRETITHALAVFFSVSFYMLFVRIMGAYQANRTYSKSTILQNEMTVRISGKGIQWNKENNLKTVPWSVFSAFKQNKEFMIIYTNPRHFNVISLKEMSPKEKDELLEYMNKYLSK